jgi:hypothetical protein
MFAACFRYYYLAYEQAAIDGSSSDRLSLFETSSVLSGHESPNRLLLWNRLPSKLTSRRIKGFTLVIVITETDPSL